MTSTELRTILASLLSAQLGEYTTASGATQTALFVGEPPNDWMADGLEVVIDPVPDWRQVPAYQRGAEVHEIGVRLVSHGNALADLATAEQRIAQRWVGVTRRRIPADEQLGILAQSTITIPA